MDKVRSKARDISTEDEMESPTDEVCDASCAGQLGNTTTTVTPATVANIGYANHCQR